MRLWQGVRFPPVKNNIFEPPLAEYAEEIGRFAEDSYAIMSHKVGPLMLNFIAIKKKFGTPLEQEVYKAISTPAQLVDRLLQKRPLMFMGSQDSYILQDDYAGDGGFDDLSTKTGSHLQLKDLISYDEMLVSALLGVSVRTHFINSGSRRNQGALGAKGTFERDGVYVGLVGARFERTGLMEWQHTLVTEHQNIPDNGYGKDRKENPLVSLWASFYNLPKDERGHPFFPSYAELSPLPDAKLKEHGYMRLSEGHMIFNTRVYRARMRLVIEPFMCDANHRAEKLGKSAYLHLVGLGLGVWQLFDGQGVLFVEAVKEVLQEVPLPHISDVDFSYFTPGASDALPPSDEVPCSGGHKVAVRYSRRDPAAPLADANKLLCAMYAWDANSFPGNEYWANMLSASGDPAAACCSTIPYLQNPFVNPHIAGIHARTFDSAAKPHHLPAHM